MEIIAVSVLVDMREMVTTVKQTSMEAFNNLASIPLHECPGKLIPLLCLHILSPRLQENKISVLWGYYIM